MAENTKIQWCDHTFNPWIGCAKVADGCLHCYAEALMADRYGRVVWGPNGTRSKTKTWGEPVRWNRRAEQEGKRRKVFCASLADVFEDRGELWPWRAELFALIDDCPNLDWLLLTKRPENIRRMWGLVQDGNEDNFGYSAISRTNVWLGTSIASARDTDNIEALLQCRALAPVLFVSLEPQIGYVDLAPWIDDLDWVIVGGESKQGSQEPRAFRLEWAERTIEICRRSGKPVFIKQLGSQAFQDVIDGEVLKRGQRFVTKDSHGGDMAEWPEHLRVRECPETFAIAIKEGV